MNLTPTSGNSFLNPISTFHTLVSGNASGMSETEIVNELDSMGAGLCTYYLEISVEAESGNAPACNHTDNGEEVEYLVEVVLLDYEIRPV